MIPELEAVWTQFTETYAALRRSLEAIPDDRLHWRPAPAAMTVAEITQHVIDANRRLINRLLGDGAPGALVEDVPGQERLLEQLEEGERRVEAALAQLTAEDLCRRSDGRWSPIGDLEVHGVRDGRWFAYQMVRHTAYHLGQIDGIRWLLEAAEAPPRTRYVARLVVDGEPPEALRAW
jgi:uncharacterized damage-inducible protein DinB